MDLYDFLTLGMQAGAVVAGFVAALALVSLALWLLLILGVVIRDVWDRWVTR